MRSFRPACHGECSRHTSPEASCCTLQVQRAAVTEMLRPAEEALIERRALLECICMPPILQSHAEGVDVVLSVLTGSAQRLSRGPLLAFAATCLLHCASH